MRYVYILYSKHLDKFYVGFTKDLRQRLNEHKCKGVYTTRRMEGWKFVYCEICISERDARIREKQLKTGFGRGYLRRRLKNYLANV